MTKEECSVQSSFDDLLKGEIHADPVNECFEPSLIENEDFMDIPLFEEEDCLILMHKEVHFSGSFSAMIEYYSDPDAKGICEEIEPARIKQLLAIEEKLGINLAANILSGNDAEKVAFFRRMNEQLSELHEKDSASFEAALAEAILSEKSVEEVAEENKSRLIQKPELLVGLATSDLFAEGLSPGYGTAPSLAILVLGSMKYQKAIPSLFLLLGQRDFVTENAVLWALHEMGDAAKTFALQHLKTVPLSSDNERSALVLLEFLPDFQVEEAFAGMLRTHVQMPETLRQYLTL
jgi:hypothetical protein